MDEDVALFDAPFFNLAADVASVSALASKGPTQSLCILLADLLSSGTGSSGQTSA